MNLYELGEALCVALITMTHTCLFRMKCDNFGEHIAQTTRFVSYSVRNLDVCGLWTTKTSDAMMNACRPLFWTRRIVMTVFQLIQSYLRVFFPPQIHLFFPKKTQGCSFTHCFPLFFSVASFLHVMLYPRLSLSSLCSLAFPNLSLVSF